jgi:hypothetical protein
MFDLQHNRQALSIKMIFKCIGNYDMYPLYAIGLTFGIAGYPINNYLQLSFKSLGFSTVKANLLSVPNTALSMINVSRIACFLPRGQELIAAWHRLASGGHSGLGTRR